MIIAANAPLHSIKVQTRAGSDIQNELHNELPVADLRARENDMRRNSGSNMSAAVLHRLSNMYNCMGLAFAARRVHIDCGSLSKILVEDRYRKVTYPDIFVGDLVVYTLGGSTVFAHVGIVVEMPKPPFNNEAAIIVLSKFGFGGEYCHPLRGVPLGAGTPSEYWTQREVGYI